MASVAEKIVSPFKKLRGFLSIFLHNIQGVVGLFIILIFAVMAFGAPLLTPYNPTNLEDQWLSGAYSAPTMLEYLPKSLGGMPGAAHNLELLDNAEFSDLSGWNYTFSFWNTTETHPISVDYAADVGVNFSVVNSAILPGGEGSAKITFTRNDTSARYGSPSIAFYKSFNYPYSGAPMEFTANLDMLPTGTVSRVDVKKIAIKLDNGTIVYSNMTVGTLDVTVQFYVYLERKADGRIFNIWPYSSYSARGMTFVKIYPDNERTVPGKGTLSWDNKNVNDTWPPPDSPWILMELLPCDSDTIRISSTLFTVNSTTSDAITQLFPEDLLPGDYLYGINMTFQDTRSLVPVNKAVETTVYLDNLWLSFDGRIWGVLGTDQYGRDLWSQLIYGAGISLYVGVLAAVLSVVLGLIVGLAAGYLGRYADEVLMRFSDMLLVIPTLPLLIVLIAVIGPALENLILVVGLLGWMGFARLVRSQVLTLKERPFVEAAKAVGAGKLHIMVKHILPNVVSLVYVSLATSVPGAIVAEAALSFLGFYDPNRMSWGRMLREAQGSGGVRYWWWILPPGLCIAFLAIAFIMLGFALDEVFNPRLRQRR